MSDLRFKKLYILKTKEGEIEELRQLCDDYKIKTNGIFERAASFHRAWGFTEDGLIYLSHTMFINNEPDFNSLNELEDFLCTFVEKN